MVDQNDKKPMPLTLNTQSLVNVVSGILSAVIGTAILHPIDRAFFFSVTKNRPFFTRLNFTNPYHAFPQALAQKTLFGSPFYFVLRDEMKKILTPHLNDELKVDELTQKAIIGCMTGSLHGFVSSVIQNIKIQTWSQEKRTFGKTVASMYQLGGPKAFLRGIAATTSRDGISSFVYEGSRHSLQKSEQYPFNYSFLCDSVAAMTATVASTLCNYVRIKQMATPPEISEPSFKRVVNELWQESNLHKNAPLKRAYFIADRMKVGLGVARYALFMPIYQKLYNDAQRSLGNYLNEMDTQSNLSGKRHP